MNRSFISRGPFSELKRNFFFNSPTDLGRSGNVHTKVISISRKEKTEN